MKTKHVIISLVAVAAVVAFGQGTLTPPGAPAPTMKTLQQVFDKVAAVSQVEPFSAYAEPTASNGALAGDTIDVPVGKIVKIESITVITYGDSGSTAHVRFLAKNGTSTSRIILARMPLVAVSSDSSPTTTRSATIQLPVFIHGGGQFDVNMGDAHSMRLDVRASSGASVTSGWIVTGTYVNP